MSGGRTLTNRAFNGFGVFDVSDHRVVLPESVRAFVPWFDQRESQECLAKPAVPKGITIFSPLVLSRHNELLATVEGRDLGPGDLGSPLHHFLRAARIFWIVTIQRKGVLHLPAAARELGLLPQKPSSKVAVCAYGGIIEIWQLDRLAEEIGRLTLEWRDLRTAVSLVAEPDLK